MTAPQIHIVRHGNTFAPGETVRRVGARTDLPLVDSGRAQAAALAAMFTVRGIIFDTVLSGPLRRTRETAALIIGSGLRVTPVPWLDEIDHGPDEGQPEAAVVARIGDAALQAWDRDALAPPGWTVDADARLSAWRAFLADIRGETLIVTSNGAARFARLALGLDAARLRTGAFARIVWTDAAPRLDAWDVRPEDV